ncbi:RNA polymerase subunit sigma-24 [Streptomyces dioscori]|uniref:RNA polymerase subunit sigma-24 n=1 Tax=Streptomyces dioscori TaxID=2109333 RepID=A0A2P8PTR3_9ACTN|nr:RNA polymerase sigma factor SigJ [Streptomyces dioscori]PSM37379.1 RNA polymerase subunit sigma-24 [Streptomyces dioscori]
MSDSPSPQTHEQPTAATRQFMEHRELLFAIVYNMLGGVADTEDVLQDTWLSWSGSRDRSPERHIENPRAYLVRVAVNHALTRRAAISRRRETYMGPWLPEPLVAAAGEEPATDAAERTLRTESVSLAMLVVLESLTPLERAVFVLNEVFGYAHTEIAEIIDRTPAAVRQLAHRARGHVHARRPLYEAHPRVRREATERFVEATLGGDIGALMEILAPDVTVWTDAGGKRRPAGLRPVHGRDKAVRLLTAGASRGAGQHLDLRYRRVNGDDAAVLFAGTAPYAVIVLDLTPEGDRVSGVYVVTNPDKLTHVHPAKAAETTGTAETTETAETAGKRADA